MLDKKKTKKQKSKQSDAVYELERYHEVALDITQGILEHIDRKRYSYPSMKAVNEKIGLVDRERDYLFAEDNGQFWKSPGRRLSETEWQEVFGNRR